MNKKFARLLGLVAIVGALSACSTTGTGDDRFYRANPEDMRINPYCLSLKEGDSQLLDYKFSPRSAYASTATFKSLDEKVAKVSKDGTVTAVGAGETVIVVSSVESPDLKKEIPVYVGKEIKKTALVNYMTNLKTKQESLPKVSKVKVEEVRYNYLYNADGDVKSGYVDDCHYTVSVNDGFVDVDGYEEDIKTTNGDFEAVRYRWVFHTNEDYGTTIFHESDDTKTYLTVNTQSFIGQDRINAVYALLDSIFTSGRKIATNQIENGMCSSAVNNFVENKDNYRSHASKAFYDGKNGDLLGFSYGGSWTDPANAEDEQDWDVYYGTTIKWTYSETYTWVNGYTRSLQVSQKMQYKQDGESLTRLITVYYHILVEDEVVCNLPNKQEYVQVGDLYDL